MVQDEGIPPVVVEAFLDKAAMVFGLKAGSAGSTAATHAVGNPQGIGSRFLEHAGMKEKPRKWLRNARIRIRSHHDVAQA